MQSGKDPAGGFAVEDPLGSFATERKTIPAPVEHHEPVRHPSPPTRPIPMVSVLLAMIAAAGWGAFFSQLARPIEEQTRLVEETAPPVERNNPVASEPLPSPERDESATSRDTPSNFDTPVPRSEPVEAMPSAEKPARQDSIATSGLLPNVAGSWMLSTQVESGSDASFTDLQLAFELQLQQQGDRVTGVGRNVAENGSAIGSGAQTPITIDGTIAGKRLTLNFVERSTARTTHGKFVLLLQEDGTMRGRFSSTAAQSPGLVEARRVSRP